MKRKFQTQWSFADIELDHEQREDFEEWNKVNGESLFETMPIVLEEGYKLSVVFKPEREAWIVTLTGMPDCQHNVNVSMSSFHQTAEQAMNLAMYKHIVIANSGDWGIISPPATWG